MSHRLWSLVCRTIQEVTKGLCGSQTLNHNDWQEPCSESFIYISLNWSSRLTKHGDTQSKRTAPHEPTSKILWCRHPEAYYWDYYCKSALPIVQAILGILGMTPKTMAILSVASTKWTSGDLKNKHPQPPQPRPVLLSISLNGCLPVTSAQDLLELFQQRLPMLSKPT